MSKIQEIRGNSTYSHGISVQANRTQLIFRPRVDRKWTGFAEKKWWKGPKFRYQLETELLPEDYAHFETENAMKTIVKESCKYYACFYHWCTSSTDRLISDYQRHPLQQWEETAMDYCLYVLRFASRLTIKKGLEMTAEDIRSA